MSNGKPASISNLLSAQRTPISWRRKELANGESDVKKNNFKQRSYLAGCLCEANRFLYETIGSNWLEGTRFGPIHCFAISANTPSCPLAFLRITKLLPVDSIQMLILLLTENHVALRRRYARDSRGIYNENWPYGLKLTPMGSAGKELANGESDVKKIILNNARTSLIASVRQISVSSRQ